MVHLHTPTRPSIRHPQESSVLKEADYLEEEEEEEEEEKEEKEEGGGGGEEEEVVFF